MTTSTRKGVAEQMLDHAAVPLPADYGASRGEGGSSAWARTTAWAWGW